MLSRDEILATSIPTEVVDVPEWGGKVIVRGLEAHERDTYEQSLLEQAPDGSYRAKRNLPNVRASFVARCLVDEAGERLFSDEDAELLGRKSAVALDRLWGVARRLSGMGSQEDEEAVLEGFGQAQADDSSTD